MTSKIPPITPSSCAGVNATSAPPVRRSPEGGAPAKASAPALPEMATTDSRGVMDVAVFRLSKRDKRTSEVIRYDLPDGYVEVTAGPYGMASVWDYDIVLMMISHLTEAMNRHRDGRGLAPNREFRPYVSEILKFCRRSDGGRQYLEIEAALDRLKSTTLKVVRTEKGRGGRMMRKVTTEGLIENYEVVSYANNGHVTSVMIRAPEWLYKEVVEGKNPNVLTVHPDYFLIEPGIGRFVYRLARRAAGKTQARWAFRTVYERSGSAGTFKEFSRLLRNLIKADGLPEYALAQETGQ